ncbi:MAG: sigma-70 family RNA polymerase sigma factor [Oscillospiraceae bacterium]|nr:sigma-70 family RNA polymerase sigma factor [Oscillospiraceae bacterium]
MEELYKHNVQIVYRFLFSQCRDEQLTEDLTQETFVRAFQSLERFDGSCKLSTWLCQIARHILLQYYEKNGKSAPTELSEELPANDDVEQQVIHRIELDDVFQKLQTLPTSMRQVVYLRVLESLSYKEIGAIMGKSENWARVNFFRAKEQLLKEVE